MNDAVRIAPARLRDLRRVAALQKRAFRPPLAYRLPTLITLWALPGVRFWVAWRQDAVAGCAIGDVAGGQSRVVNICVDPDCRRLGIARLLLRELEASLPTGDMLLMVQVENEAAQALYRSEGYAETGRSPNYYGPRRDGLWMRKSRTASPARKLYV